MKINDLAINVLELTEELSDEVLSGIVGGVGDVNINNVNTNLGIDSDFLNRFLVQGPFSSLANAVDNGSSGIFG